MKTKTRKRVQPIPTLKDYNKGDEEDKEEATMYLEQLRTMSPISFKRKDTINHDTSHIYAIIPFNLGKIQRPTTYKNDYNYVINLETSFKVTHVENDIQNSQETPKLQDVSTKTRSLSTKFPASSHHYFKKNLHIFSPGIVRIIPKDSRPKTPLNIPKHTITEFLSSKTPSPKKTQNLSQLSSKINISPLKKRTEETKLLTSFVTKSPVSPISRSLALEKGEEFTKDDSSHLRIECYKGDYSNGKRHGYGEIVYNNGDSYNGNWVNNKKEGKGRYFYNFTKTVYSGEWLNNKRHGEGKMKFKNGDKIIGT